MVPLSISPSGEWSWLERRDLALPRGVWEVEGTADVHLLIVATKTGALQIHRIPDSLWDAHGEQIVEALEARLDREDPPLALERPPKEERAQIRLRALDVFRDFGQG